MGARGGLGFAVYGAISAGILTDQVATLLMCETQAAAKEVLELSDAVYEGNDPTNHIINTVTQ